MKIFDDEEYNQTYTQYLQANARGDFKTAAKLAKILSEKNHTDPEFQKMLTILGIEEWTPEKDTLRKKLNRDYWRHKRDGSRVRKFGPKKYKPIPPPDA